MFESNPADRIPQIDAMRFGVDLRLDVTLRNFSLTVRPLSIMEQMQVAAKVVDKFKMLPPSAQNNLSETMITAKETLIVASTSDVGKEDPKISDYILDRMMPSEVSFLWKQYMAACDKVNPVIEKMPADQLEQLISALKKNTLELTELSFQELVNICQHLIKGE